MATNTATYTWLRFSHHQCIVRILLSNVALFTADYKTIVLVYYLVYKSKMAIETGSSNNLASFSDNNVILNPKISSTPRQHYLT